ncbi:MAG: glucosyltransferase [Lachnospiraceae bacterium]|nr:glucosyltransferase [Lachnospiraceae bacterium]
MSKIVFFCIPAHGHTNPTLGVVKELVERGHEVLYYSYEPFRSKIEGVGARFVPCDKYDAELSLDPKDAHKVGKDLALSTKLLVDTTLSLDDMVCEEMMKLKPDCIVADSMAVWGKAVALKLGIPFISSTTTFAFNQHSSKIMKQGLGDLFGMLLSMPKIGKDIKRLQDKGYPITNILDIIQNDNNTNTIVYTSPEFQPCAETFSDKYAFVGPSIRPVESSIVKEKEKLVYISMGTVNNNMISLYKNCIEALKDTDYQVIMSVGEETDISTLGQLPPNISVYPKVDQMAVLKEADVFLSHCGMNSVNESLYYSVPLVMYPQTSEQGGVATRVEQVGAGLKLQKKTASAIREAVEKVLGDSNYQLSAARIAEGFRMCSGASGAADKILKVIAQES